jgi:PilZ domain-containing protein
MTDQANTATSNVRSLPGNGQGKLRTPQGEELPVRTFERGREVMLVVLVNVGDYQESDRLESVDLEYTSARGLIKLHGEAVFEDHSLIRFRTEEGAVEQRRSFVRVQTPHPVTLDVGEPPELRAHTVDLSGGGMLLSGADNVEPGEALAFSIGVGEGEPPVEGVARVVRVEADGKRALVFDDIDEYDRQRLIRFVFECMRHARARTRGDFI